MAENESTLFRKSTLERISSPDKLNEYIKVTNPSLILMLLGIFIILITGVFWIFAGVIPKTVDISGVVATNISGDSGVYCYVPIGTSKRLAPGMDVQISPDYADKEQYGYIKGKVVSVGTKVVTDEYLASSFPEPQTIYSAISTSSQSSQNSTGNLVEVKLSMNEWSSKAGSELEITDGTLCEVSAIVENTKLSQLIFSK